MSAVSVAGTEAVTVPAADDAAGTADPGVRAGRRIEALLQQFSDMPDRRAQLWAEDLVRAVSDLYGAALARVVAISGRCSGSGAGHRSCLEQLAGDELVANVLVLHDLHPRDLEERVVAAAAGVVASVSSVDVKVLDVDCAAATVRLRLLVEPGSVASTSAVERQLRRAVHGAAPEIETVVVDRPPASVPVQLIARR